MLQDFVAVQAEQRGGAGAVVMGDERLTYRELESASNRLARHLIESGCRRGDRVCLLVPKCPAAIVGMLGALKAGCAYVPVDIASPAARVAKIVSACEPAATITTAAAAALAGQLQNLGVEVALDSAETAAAIAAQAAEPLPAAGGPEDVAHILFTSGSTGEPKGVMITHANVSAFVSWANDYFGTRPGDRISGHPPLHFDLSTFDIYGTFRAGAELHLVPADTLLPRHLGEFITSHALTQWFCVPSTMTYMAQFGGLTDGGFPTLERVLWCGEVLPTPVLAQWMRAVPQATFTNLYGPTEATIASSYYTVPGIPADDTAPIPIGTPCAGEELFVVSGRGQPAQQGDIGELCIAGAGLSPGYWRDPQRTSAQFAADPRPGRDRERAYRTGDLARVGEDGLLHFLGRTDSQIKSRGYRIELGEIEAAVNALAEVGECAVVAVKSDGFDGTTICCAYAPANGVRLEPPAMRIALAASLPAYMLPTRWAPMDALPRNGSGKIDRRALHERFTV